MKVGIFINTAKIEANTIANKFSDILTDNGIESKVVNLKEDCKDCFCFLFQALALYSAKNGTKLRAASDVIKWRCEKYPKKKAEGVLKVLDLIIRGEI